MDKNRIAESLVELEILPFIKKVEGMTENVMKSCEELGCTFDESIQLLRLITGTLEGILKEYPDKRNEVIKLIEND